MSGLIVHEWLERFGGSERVVEEMAKALPDTPIFSLWNNDPDRFPSERVTESVLARTPLRGRKGPALPFIPSVWKSLDVSDLDWMLISSHSFAHQAGFRSAQQNDVTRLAYIHSPARYLWVPELDARGGGVVARTIAPPLKHLDAARAKAGGAHYAANSEYIRKRIRTSWDVDADVIYPPVAIELLQSEADWANRLTGADEYVLSTIPETFVLGASRFVSYKQLDKVIDAARVLDVPVVLAGAGPEQSALEAYAASLDVPLTIVPRPSNELLYALYQRAMLFVFPAIEDFGIMPVEAIALGTPVLVNTEGGAIESATATAGGIAVDEFLPAEIKLAADQALALDMDHASRAAHRFSETAFEAQLLHWMGRHIEEFAGAQPPLHLGPTHDSLGGDER